LLRTVTAFVGLGVRKTRLSDVESAILSIKLLLEAASLQLNGLQFAGVALNTGKGHGLVRL